MVVRGDAASAPRSSSRPGSSASARSPSITDAAALEHELDAALRFAPHVTRVDADVAGVARRPLRRPRRARPCDALGAGFERSDYGQKAIAARLVATLPHRHVARQWFRSPDVLALLPFDRPAAGALRTRWSGRCRPSAPMRCWRSTPAGVRARAAAGRPAPRSATLRSAPSAPPGRSSLGGAAIAGAGRAGCCSATPPTSCTRSPARASTSASPTSPRWLGVIAEREPWRGVGDERLLRRYCGNAPRRPGP